MISNNRHSISEKRANHIMELAQVMTFNQTFTTLGIKRSSLKNRLIEIRNKFGVKVNFKEEELKKNSQPKVVGIIGDVHIPFHHPNYLQFLKDTFEKWGVTDIVNIGDLVDNHALSRHQTETIAMGSNHEFNISLAEVKKYTDAFPKGKLTLGNHDMIPYRQAATLGLGTNHMKSFKDLWELPDTWEVAESFVIDNVLYTHGINAAGVNGAMNLAIKQRLSSVIGHAHSFGGVKYNANARDIIFGMNVGCGIDVDAYAFYYGKFYVNKPTLGCGIVISDSEAYFIPMGDKYFRH